MAARKSPHRAEQGASQAHLAARATARRGRAVRRRAGGGAGRRAASRLRADRHHQRGRALPSPDSLHAHSGTTEREHLRQAQSVDKTVFEYWTHALSYVPSADMRFFVRAMKQEWRHRSPLVRRGDARRTCARCSAASAATARSRSATSTTTCWWRRSTNGRAASRRSARCSSPSIGGVLTVSRREGMLKTYELMDRHFGWDRCRRRRPRASGRPICSTARCARRASSASTRSAISMRRARRRSPG